MSKKNLSTVNREGNFEMACRMCSRNTHCHQSFHGIRNSDVHHYSDVPTIPDDEVNEPVAPTLSLGNRILWLTEARAASGIVKWIGRIPSISTNWTAGVEFDNVMPGGSNGDFRGRQYFQSRLGHAVFLPVSDLIKVDTDGSTNGGERTSFFGRLQDSCTNFAHRRRRDSTFGHFKQDYCSNCTRNDLANFSHYCHSAPVYDRITTRRSLCYDEQPYEMYNACVPCGSMPNGSTHFHNASSRKPEESRRQPCIIEDRISEIRPVSRSLDEFPNDNFMQLNTRKDSFFSPKPSLSFINGFNGFKEWVSCLVLGTNRKKRQSKIVFKDKKSVTNVFFAQNTRSLTGQRLSSFADYATVSINRVPKQEAVTAKSDVETKSKAVEKQGTNSRARYRKKRPAPLPPIEYTSTSHGKNKANEAAAVKKLENGVVNGAAKGKETKYKIVRSSSFRIHATPQRRRPKKRRAPLPPVSNSNNSERDMKSISVPNSVPESSNGSIYYEKKKGKQKNSQVVLEKSKQNASLPKTKSKNGRNKIIYQSVRNRAIINGESDSGEESDSEDSKNSSNSMSFSEDDSDDDKYGLVKYGIINKINSSEGNLNMPSTSNFVQYAGENNDVCLKISIQKTETNVVTVEEVTSPLSTTHYTIEEDSSSSELSDNNIVQRPEIKPITYKEPKLNSADSSSVSAAEDAGEKTIFEELQIKPPAKGSVKDFVTAFNMLASKSNYTPIETKKLKNAVPHTQSPPKEITEVRDKPKDFQSFPTKWEYQNKASNLGYVNKFLLPIAEESHNETSEHDGNLSFDDSKPAPCKEIKCTGKNIHAGKKTSEVNDNSSKKCSHCSETHVQSFKNNSPPKSLKKRNSPRKESLRSSLGESSQASLAALSSLLDGKSSGTKDDKLKNSTNSLKNSSKLDQPIMVGLYIEDKSSHRGPIPLLVTPSMSLKKLKKQIEKDYEFPKHQQCWILGESFAVADEASLASYGVTEPGCPVLLYVMSKDTKSYSLPARAALRHRRNSKQESTDSSEEEVTVKSKGHWKKSLKTKPEEEIEIIFDARKQTSMLGAVPKTDKILKIPSKVPPRTGSHKKNDIKSKKTKSEFHKAWEAEYEKKADYHHLLALDDVDLVANVEKFECPVCFLDVEIGDGATLQECLHSFCKECLAGAIQFSDTAIVKCPFRNDEYSCECHLQEREVKSLVTPDVYERHLQRSMALAESQAQDSFHCKTPDCRGWCLYEDNVNTFLCPVCKHTNCLTCAAIHEGKNCRQYQDDVAFRCDSSEEARKTKEYLQSMVDNGEAMRCPKCHVILMKKWGCDWLKCSMCHTEVCWVTKGPRWGPGGRGDTSGGCKCMVDGVRCHPKCSYCH